MMQAPNSRDPKHLTVWQAWTYLVDKSRMTKSVRQHREDALKVWERRTADPIIAAISPTTLKEFRAGQKSWAVQRHNSTARRKRRQDRKGVPNARIATTRRRHDGGSGTDGP